MQSWLGQSWDSTSGHAIGSDDAYISYRYAKNFFDGYGLVFNPGERVEGYSNFFYILLIVPVFLLSADLVYQYSILINCLLLSLSIYVFYSFLTRRFAEQKAILGTLLLALNPWVWANAATGLETMLILAITTGAWILVEDYLANKDKNIILALLFLSGLSILSRVDGFILPLAISAYATFKSQRRLAIYILLLVVAFGILYTAWRYWYYHDVIANTYYSKVSGNILSRVTSGLAYLYENAKNTGFWVPLCIIGLRLAGGVKDFNINSRVDFALFFIVLWSAYLIYIGGDIYYERFIVALFPMGIYTAMTIIQTAKNGLAWPIVFIVMLAIQSGSVVRDGRFEYSLNKYDCWIAVGRFLGANYPGRSLAVDAAGKIPYFSGLKSIDMLGLNDRHIGKMTVDRETFWPGHMKYDAQYVMSLKPDLIAGWATPDTGLYWGLTKKTYEKGYSLKYLVNTGRDDKKDSNIIDVSQTPEDRKMDLVRGDYKYAILIRNTMH